jgi:hypothetical protein
MYVGQTTSSTGQSTCIDCSIGSFKPVYQYGCSSCPPGFYSNTAGAAICQNCSSGSGVSGGSAYQCPLASTQPLPEEWLIDTTTLYNNPDSIVENELEDRSSSFNTGLAITVPSILAIVSIIMLIVHQCCPSGSIAQADLLHRLKPVRQPLTIFGGLWTVWTGSLYSITFPANRFRSRDTNVWCKCISI